MKIIALDQSTTATGLSIFKNDKLINYILIKPKSSKRVSELVHELDEDKHIHFLKMPEGMFDITLLRITAIVDVIEQIIEKEKPDALYMEEVFENKNPKSRNPKGVKSLARLQGFIAHVCYKHNIPYRIVEENKWITTWGTYSNKIKRPERKADVMKKVNDLYGLDITVDDLSDSIGIGKYAIEIEKENDND